MAKVDVEAAKKAKFTSAAFDYSEKDVILYALGVGATRTDLNLVYENSDEFVALPTFAVNPAFDYQMKNIAFGDYLPDFNPMMLVHGEQFTRIVRKLKVAEKVTSTGRIIDILDKGKGAAVIVGVDTHDLKGNLVAQNEFTFFIRGQGGFGGKKDSERGESTKINNPPERKPDFVVSEKVQESQAVLFRLSGDYNPLHVDPDMAAMGGFEMPILHGLCTYGISGKHIFQKFGDYKSIKARFAKHVFPGETLETEMWKEGNRVIFRTRVVERNVIAISNAAVELRGQIESKL